MDVTEEISFQTTRSGGKGGQNVNKVETAVIALFYIEGSKLLTQEQKLVIHDKLGNRINSSGHLWVRSETQRTQLGNKKIAVQKINSLLTNILRKRKIRVATKPSAAAKEKRIELKKRMSDVKRNRRKYKGGEQ